MNEPASLEQSNLHRSESEGSASALLLLAGVVALAVLLSIPTMKMGLWLDECISIHSATAKDLSSMVANMYGRTDDLHPPLFHIILFLFMNWFGQGEIAVRVPSLLCGLGLIVAMFYLGKTAKSSKVGLIAAFFAAVSPFNNYYACQARPYELATLFTALSLAFFIKLSDPANSRAKQSFILFVVATAALFYTHYMGCLMAPVLGFASLVIYWQRRRHDEAQARKILLRALAAIALSTLLFGPWMPSVLQQSGGGFNAKRTPLSMWPQVFAFNLTMMMPLPALATQYLAQYAAPLVVVVWLFWHRQDWCNREWFAQLKGRAGEKLDSMPHQYVTLLSTVLIPSTLVGIVTPFWFGYFRYIYSFSPAQWVLLAVACAYLLRKSESPERLKPVATTVLLASLLVLNALYLVWFDSKPQSGLRTVAHDAREGKYDNCAIMMAPDYISETLDYYLSHDQCAKHHILLCGFPRFTDPFTPCRISDLAPLWGPPTIVDDALGTIARLPQQGYRYLAFCRDSDKLTEWTSTDKFPKLKRIQALIAELDKKYKLLRETEYYGVCERVKIRVYKLEPGQ